MTYSGYHVPAYIHMMAHQDDDKAAKLHNILIFPFIRVAFPIDPYWAITVSMPSAHPNGVQFWKWSELKVKQNEGKSIVETRDVDFTET